MVDLAWAEDLAARTLSAIDARYPNAQGRLGEFIAADRERVTSDLAGLRECWQNGIVPMTHVLHAARYEANLRRTAALYPVTP